MVTEFVKTCDEFVNSRREILELQAEAKYYCIEELNELCEKSVKNMKKENLLEVEPICRVPLITSLKEEQVNEVWAKFKLNT